MFIQGQNADHTKKNRISLYFRLLWNSCIANVPERNPNRVNWLLSHGLCAFWSNQSQETVQTPEETPTSIRLRPTSIYWLPNCQFIPQPYETSALPPGGWSTMSQWESLRCTPNPSLINLLSPWLIHIFVSLLVSLTSFIACSSVPAICCLWCVYYRICQMMILYMFTNTEVAS